MTCTQTPFTQLFNDPNYAWQLLEWEIAIEMNDSLSGQAIAKLLELYMRGVERMNSIMDIRQSYFKNKVTALMTKNTVVKTLSKPPMAKKEKPLEMVANGGVKKQIKVLEKTKIKETNQIKPPPKIEVKPSNNFALQEKKREIEMRLAYEAQESTRENLSKILNQHQKKQENFQDKVKVIMTDHEERLKQRINRRKLKTATYRSRPEDTNDTSSKQMDFEIIQQKKQIDENFSHSKNFKTKHKSQQKRFKSLENRVAHDLTLQDSPKRPRKSTFDMTGESSEPTLELTRIKSDELRIPPKQ